VAVVVAVLVQTQAHPSTVAVVVQGGFCKQLCSFLLVLKL
jgi:hypothetical protein